MAGRTVQQIYQKKSPIEHVLIRPDTYVGSIQLQKSFKWVLKKDQPMLEYREISFVPALFKIFDEVLVNATDNYQRDRKMNLLKVTINAKEGWISVHNNGKGIPIAIHKEHNIYVPELIFGHLLTGSNYDDTEKKVVGGRNGYGAKLANIFSTKFIVECGDGAAKKKFRMVWRDNMMSHAEAEITPHTGKDFVTITFYPEFSRFGMEDLDEDTVALLSKRVYDMAGLLSRVKVFLNDQDISMSSFKKYVGMYFGPDSQLPIIYDPEVTTDRWEIVVSISEGEFRQVSFVNGICTTKGGKHVDYISNQIVEKIQEKIKKKSKDMVVKPFQVKAHLWIFVNCLIENPTFDSQTKETMTLKISDFGSQCQLSDKMIKEILKSGVVDQIYDQAKLREQRKFANQVAGKKTNRVTGVPKLQDANNAGTKHSEKCTLILTQGDSAKGLAMSGLEVIGRDNYGVFPLKGKLLNVREAPSKVLLKNDQIQSMMKIVGLNPQKQYQDVKSLRYGSIMIMADQDTDGSHIKGLVINFIHHFWPSLFQMQGFLQQFITPLLKSIKGKESIPFYTMKDFKDWAEEIQNLKSWKIKYYKGLGTSTDKQGQQYFSNLQRHKINFQYVNREDDEAMLLIFSKKMAEQRKNWLSRYDPNVSMVYDRPQIRYKEFVDREFIHYSNEDNYRSIGSSVDGFKPGQRKIIFACFKRNLREEIKVAQLTGNVSENSAYHHGEMSLTETIVKMAQSFVGTNNINLLLPLGQFGSRNQGGKDHASARYIFTNLSRLTRLIFPEPDDHSLKYIEDDGQMVEPEYYMPIIPMYLVNGCEGIGTGWSTYIPTFNPHEMTEILIDKLSNGTEFPEIHPWVKGYLGTITKKSDDNYEMKGIIDVDYENKLFNIREITVGKWTKVYKKFLEDMLEEGQTVITNFKEYHTNNRIHFQLEVNQTFFDKYHDNIEYLEKYFKLTGNISMNNLIGFDREHKIKKFPTAMHIFNDFYEIRLEYYHLRKAYMISQLVRDLQIMTMKERFIMEIIQDQLVIKNIKKIVICETLKKRGYTPMKNFPKVKSTKPTSKSQNEKDKDKEEGENESEEEEDTNVRAKDYDYLLSLPIYSLTYEKVEEIKKNKQVKEAELESLEQTKVETLWINDLQEFKIALEKYEQKEEEERINGQSKRKGKTGNNKRVKGGGKKGKEQDKVKGKKKEKEALNWDSSGDDAKDSAKTEHKKTSKDNKKPQTEKSKAKSKPKPKQQKQKQKAKNSNKLDIEQKPQSSARSSFMERVKQKLKSKQQKNAIDGYVMKPYSKTNLDSEKEQEQVRIVRVPATKPKRQKRKKRMSLGSDDESDEEQQENQWQMSD